MAQALTKQKQKAPQTTADVKVKVAEIKSARKQVHVPAEIPITSTVANRAKREKLCVLCLAKGNEKPEPALNDGCRDRMHIMYIRRLTRWARRIAIQATPYISSQELHSYKRRQRHATR